MKKVLSHGNSHYIGICPNCNCKFEYDLNDVYEESMLEKNLLSEKYLLTCPECGNKQERYSIYNVLEAYHSNDK